MPVGIIQPSNKIKQTNIAIVRMRKGKKQFEVPCYKNKILDWKNNIETDLDNVLQTDQNTVFLNASTGQHASKADLAKAWPGLATKDVIEDILRYGKFQVGQKERDADLERTQNEVINIVASKLVDPKTKRVYTTGMIEKALDQLRSQSAKQQAEKSDVQNGEENGKAKELPKWTGVKAQSDVKRQAICAIKCLVAHQPIPVARIQIRLRITCPTSVIKQTIKSSSKASQPKDATNAEAKTPTNVKDVILSYFEDTPSQETTGAEWEAVGLVEPGTLKTLNDFIESQAKGRGNIEILDMAVGVDV